MEHLQSFNDMGAAGYLMAGLFLLLAYAVYNLINPKNVQSDIAELVKLGQQNQAHLLSELSSVTIVTNICFVAGWLLTSRYAINFFSGSDIRYLFDWTLIEWGGAIIGIVVTTAITAVQYILYSTVDTKRAGAAVTAGILIFVVLSEVSSPMESEDLKMRTRSEQSPVFQSLVKGLEAGNQNTESAYAIPLANAEAELAKDQQMLSTCTERYKTKRAQDNCIHKNQTEIAQDKATIATLHKQQAVESQNKQQASAAQRQDLKAMATDEDNHSAFIKFLMMITGASAAIFASALSAAIVVVAFEIAFHFTGSRRATLKAALIELGNEDITYIQEQKRMRKADKFKRQAQRYKQAEQNEQGTQAGASNLAPPTAKIGSKVMDRFKQNAQAGHPSPALKAAADSATTATPAPQKAAKKPQFEQNKKLMAITKPPHLVTVTTGILDGSLPSQNQMTKLEGVSSHPARAMIDLLYALDYVAKNQNGTFSLNEGVMQTNTAKQTAISIQEFVKGKLEKLEVKS